MSMPKLTGFLISLTLFSFFVGIYGLFYSDIADKYGTDYQNESLVVYNKLNEMHTEAYKYQNRTKETYANKNFIEKGVDIFGGIFSAGTSAVRITFDSVDVFFEMTKAADSELSKANLGATTGYLRLMIGTVVLILLFVGIFLAIIVKWNL